MAPPPPPVLAGVPGLGAAPGTVPTAAWLQPLLGAWWGWRGSQQGQPLQGRDGTLPYDLAEAEAGPWGRERKRKFMAGIPCA